MTSAASRGGVSAGVRGTDPDVFATFRIVALALVALLGLWLAYQVWLALQTGTARVRRDRVQ